jgi:DNA invertase Pin-like site-specific DNA recombinase
MADILGDARVSTMDQDLDAQRHRIADAGAIRNFDDVVSGRTFERPGRTTLLDYARNGDVLCVVRLDRPGRSLRELLETLEMLKQRGIALLSLQERIDTTSAAGELICHVFAAIAHFERRLIAERTRDGLQAAAAKGRRPGRPRTEEETISSALALIEAGLPPARAARQLGMGRSTLYRLIAERKAA